MKFLIFFVGNKKFAIPLEDVDEFFKLEDITELDLLDKKIRGLINHRGKIVSIIDLEKCLGFKEKSDFSPEKIIHLQLKKYEKELKSLDNIEVALNVHEISGILTINDEQIRDCTDKKKNISHVILNNNEEIFSISTLDVINTVKGSIR